MHVLTGCTSTKFSTNIPSTKFSSRSRVRPLPAAAGNRINSATTKFSSTRVLLVNLEKAWAGGWSNPLSAFWQARAGITTAVSWSLSRIRMGISCCRSTSTKFSIACYRDLLVALVYIRTFESTKFSILRGQVAIILVVSHYMYWTWYWSTAVLNLVRYYVKLLNWARSVTGYGRTYRSTKFRSSTAVLYCRSGLCARTKFI
jgi:hypothetical protein